MASTTRTETVTPAVIHIVPSSSASPPVTTEDAANAAAAEAAPVETPKQVAWKEGTLDNEDLGRKSSKICCIYHKPRAFGESSSSSSSDSEGEDRSSRTGQHGSARKPRRCKHQRRPNPAGGEGGESRC
ncbi:hypothetical protein, conserved [Eimeria maxima]|uniref:Type 1 phosphatases regulator n=1 Tax=Eimeria maxima TaxID=5804 RepID=U6M1E1_EIMMA|nr:hypothetical protein, conserved [Eimeria maxima]CDJ56264.1 hypothetical protein, conserved [Eimeria maxima]